MSEYRSRNRQPFLSTVLIATILGSGSFLITEMAAKAEVPFKSAGGGAPAGRGGASRGDTTCSDNPAEFARRFIPLTPANTRDGVTLAERPTLFAYIPPSSAPKVFFNLRDEQGQVHYQTVLPLTKGGGIMRFELPASTPPLTIGKRYQWGVALLCTGKLRPDSPFISSWIQRVAPSIGDAGKTMPREQNPMTTNVIWHDRLTALADLRQQKQQDSKSFAEWQKFLSTAGFGEIASEPLH